MLKVTQSTSNKNAVRNAVFCSPQSKVATFPFALIDGKWIKKIESSPECTDFSLLYVNNCDRKNMDLVLFQSVTVEKIELEYLHREDKITVLSCDPKISIVEHLEQILQSVKGTVVEPDMEYMPIHKIRVKFLVTVPTYINEDCILSMEERSSGGTISNMSKIDFTTIKIGEEQSSRRRSLKNLLRESSLLA